jgi:hypothetical protein
MMKIAAVGLVALGVVHVLVGVLALSIAWSGGSSKEASATGAFATLAEQPFGNVVLWVCAVGLVGLAVWQISEAIWGYRDKDGLELVGKRVGSGGKALAYLGLAFIAGRTAIGSSSGSSNEEGFTAKLLNAPAGQFLVGAIGVGIIAIAIYLAHRGVTKAFVKKLEGQASPTMIRIGQVGHIAKAVSYGIVGVLFITAAVRHDPNESGGIDEALATLRDQPYGQWLLTAVALGLIAYGIFAFAWARAMQAKS